MTGADTGIYRSLTIWFWVLVALLFVRFLVVLIKKQKAEAIFTGAMVAVFCILYAAITYEYDRSVMMLCACVFIWCYFLLRLAYYVWKKGWTVVKNLLIAAVLFILFWVFVVSRPPVLFRVFYSDLEEARVKIGTKYFMPTYYPKEVDPDLYDYSDKRNLYSGESYYAHPIQWNAFAFLPPDDGLRNVTDFNMNLSARTGGLPKATEIYEYTYFVDDDTDYDISDYHQGIENIVGSNEVDDEYWVTLADTDCIIVLGRAERIEDEYHKRSYFFAKTKLLLGGKYSYITIMLQRINYDEQGLNEIQQEGEKRVLPELEKVIQSLKAEAELQ
ncbi:MAG TPA: hypothetical protein DEB31_04295 [Clostridiales bacterium]|nr:hypothetical protein [Clostridiales bacterium]